MARGWENEAVGDRIADAAGARPAAGDPRVSPEAHGRSTRRETVRVERARTLVVLQATCDRRRRAQLEETLARLDAELAVLDGGR